MYFDDQKIKASLEEYLRIYINVPGVSNEDQKRLSRIALVARSMLENPAAWNDRCQFAIENFGGALPSEFSMATRAASGNIGHLYMIIFRFIFEFEFFSPPDEGSFLDILSVRGDILSEAINGNDELSDSIRKIAFSTPIHIAKKLINSPNLNLLRKATNIFEEADKKASEWNGDLSARESRVNELKLALESVKHKFNFAGLFQGFSTLYSSKSSERFVNLIILSFLGLLLLVPVAVEFYISAIRAIHNTPFSMDSLLVIVGAAPIELILLYYFRIYLHERKSLTAQIMQLELRMTLCQFIQSYVEYSKEAKSTASGALERFENIIFANIQSNPEKLPGTFDGIEQLGSFIKSIKS